MQLPNVWSHTGMEGRDLSLLKQPLWGSINLSVAGINTSMSLPPESSFILLRGSVRSRPLKISHRPGA